MEDHVEVDGRIEGACAQLPLDAARGDLSESPEPPGRRAVACPGGPWVSGPVHSRASSQEEDVETPTGRAAEDVAPDHRKDLARRRRDLIDEKQSEIERHSSCGVHRVEVQEGLGAMVDRVPPQPPPAPVDGHTGSNSVKCARDSEIEVQIRVLRVSGGGAKKNQI